jgi:(p)ppGpp synthase/HD superfamily hydrolase
MNAYDFHRFCVEQHDVVCNQKYAKEYPYSFHLTMVKAQCYKFGNLLTDRETNIVAAGCSGHDLIEDARMSYNDLKEMIGEEVSEIIFLCTEMRGRDRSERKNDVFYHQLSANRLAVFVKLCDIIANSMFSVSTGSSMLKKYKAEYTQKVKPMLYREEFKSMFDYLEQIYKL